MIVRDFNLASKQFICLNKVLHWFTSYRFSQLGLSIQVIHHTFCEEELEILNAMHAIMAIDELLAHLNNNNHGKQLPILTIVELPDSSLLHPEIKILFGRHNLIYISNNVGKLF